MGVYIICNVEAYSDAMRQLVGDASKQSDLLEQIRDETAKLGKSVITEQALYALLEYHEQKIIWVLCTVGTYFSAFCFRRERLMEEVPFLGEDGVYRPGRDIESWSRCVGPFPCLESTVNDNNSI